MTIACHPQRPITRRLVRDALRRDPEDRWAAAFGRIAGYSFAVAVVTGILLLPFFRPSMATLVYHGSYRLLDGVTMSQAYQSVLAISFDVRGGLLIRQVHHWSADLFVAAVILRLLRVFFRGRFSGRALPGWLIWVALLPLGMLAAYTGTILPDDGLSGGSLGVITGVLLSVPVIGTHLVFWIFGGAPPGHQIIGRDYWVHILVLPVLAGALLLASFRPSLRWPRRVRLGSAAAVHLRGAGPARHDRADQPGVAGRAVPAGQHQLRRGAGLVHGVPRRPAADHAGLGAAGRRASAGPRRADPGPGRARPVLHLPGPLPAGGPADHRRGRRAARGGRRCCRPRQPTWRTAPRPAWPASPSTGCCGPRQPMTRSPTTCTWISTWSPGYSGCLCWPGQSLAFLLTRVISHALADRRRDEERHGRETGRIVMNPQGGYTEIREPAHRAAAPSADPPGPATARHRYVAARQPARHGPDSLAGPVRGSGRGSPDRS